MFDVLRETWLDDTGSIASIETMFLFVVFVLGLIAGWTNLRNAVDAEFTEMSYAILALNQSFQIAEADGCDPLNPLSFGAGSSATDTFFPDSLAFSQVPPGVFSEIDVEACP